MDAESLTFLLRGGHYNMEQRRERGIWPHPPLSFGNLVKHLVGILERERWFPFEPTARLEGEAVYEGVLVERQGVNRFACHCQRAHPLAPGMVADQSTKIFNKAEDAACFYLRWNLNLPGDLDSWKVLE